MHVYVIEATYQSDRHGNQYWGPIAKPTGKGYAVFSDKAKADALVAKLTTSIENEEGLEFDVGIMGNDFPVSFRVTKQTA